MRARSFVVVVLVALVTAGIGATGQGAAAASADEQTYIVTVDEQHDPAVVSERLEQAGKGQTRAVYRGALNGFATELSASDVGTVRAAPGVESVRPSRRFAAAAARARAVHGRQGMPDHDAWLAPDAGRSQLRGAGDGKGSVDINVAVIDSGVDANHADLRVAGGVNCFDDGVPVGVDLEGHGTIVAGILAAKDNKQYIVGVAPGARIWSVRGT